MTQKLFVSDLDGTLLQSDATISEFSRNKILAFLEEGIHFTVATARSVTSVQEILGDIPFKLPVICANGGTVYEYPTKKLLQACYLEPHFINEVLEDMKAKGDTAIISAIVDGEEKVYYEALQNYAMEWYYEDRLKADDHRLERVNDLTQVDKSIITTITFMNRKHHIDKLKKYFLKRYKNQVQVNTFENKYSLGWYWLSIHSKDATKGNAIQFVRQKDGLEDAEVIVFGDEKNDLPMFEIADVAYAVGKAQTAIVHKADKWIGKEESDAVVQEVERLIGSN